MEKPIETIKYKGYAINVYHDLDPIDPTTEWDMLGTMACWHSRYNLGHDQPIDDPDKWAIELANQADPTVEQRIDYWSSGKGWVSLECWSMKKAIEISNKRIHSLVWKTLEKHYIMLPLYLYDHSGITINTSGFNCQWDSGQVGWIYVSKEEIKKEFNWFLLNKKRIKKVIDILNSEVKAYDDYLTSNIYGYTIDEIDDSCWGFYGRNYWDNGLMESAKNAIDYHVTKMHRIQLQEDQQIIGDMSQLIY
jgi:hypothetical protein